MSGSDTAVPGPPDPGKDGTGTGVSSQQEGASASGGFRRHEFLDYQGYSFPWYATLIWIAFFVGAIWYFVKHVLLS